MLTFWRGMAADVAVAVVATGVMVVAAAESGDRPARPMDAWVIIAIAVLGAWTGLARQAPRAALVGSCVSFYTVLALGVPAFSPALALGVPVLAAAWSGYLWWGVAVLGVVAVTSAPYRLFGPGAEPVGQVALNTLFDLALVAVLLLLGEALRSRRALRREVALRLQLVEQDHQRRLTEARLRAARDLHDVLAHTVAVVGIHAGVAVETIDTRPSDAKRAMERVRTATQEATADLRSTIAVLRDGSPESSPEPTPGVRQVADLAAVVREAGIDVHHSVRGDVSSLRPWVELTVFRIVQESVTNVLRHSAADSVWIDIDCTPDDVSVIIRDDGDGGRATGRAEDGGERSQGRSPDGSGLRGMAERVDALGGHLKHGTADDGRPGYVVQARLPTGSTP
jgi:signal transduction histidine kinase